MRHLLFTLCFAAVLLSACLPMDENSGDVEATTEQLGTLTPAQSEALCPAVARARATSAIRALQNGWFSSGNWSNTDWWHQANLLEAISNYAGYEHDGTFNSALDPFFWHENVLGLLFSRSYDDAQWVALGWLRADDIAPNAGYRDRGKTFYNYAASAWDTSKCGGGVWWSGAHDYKNAITNELFIVSSMKMYEKTHDASYLATAKKAWAWFASSGMINANGLINDGLNTSTCKNNGQTVWTYNQGVILGGLAMLSNATGDGSYVDRGAQIIDAVLRSSLVTSDGILKESCESSSQDCNKDQYLFKGIFVRYLGYFLTEAHRPDLVAKYRPFLAANVDAIWNRARSSDTFDNRWTGPFRGANAQTQGSALDALNTAVELADASFCPTK
jgi:predicted alpha-1,6-mannanase (GH76 family)